jgi:hypothetical protein
MEQAIKSVAEILNNKDLTAIEMYITILEEQLETMPKQNFTTNTIKACLNLAKDIQELYNIKNNKN